MSRYTISKDFAFSASHRLQGLPYDHPCGRIHGHNYVVRVTLTGASVDETGFVLDYGKLKPFGAWIDSNLDHQHLNDRVNGVQPSAENLARILHQELCSAVPLPEGVTASVSVSETPKTWATYSPGRS